MNSGFGFGGGSGFSGVGVDVSGGGIGGGCGADGSSDGVGGGSGVVGSGRSIVDFAMLVALRFKMLGMNKLDRGLTSEINRGYLGLGDDAGDYRRCVIHRDELRELMSIRSRMRDHHDDVTRGWGDGWRLLPNVDMVGYLAWFNGMKLEFDECVGKLGRGWLDLVSRQRERLGERFRVGDYPGVSCVADDGVAAVGSGAIGGVGRLVLLPDFDLSRHFGVKLLIEPMATRDNVVGDFEDAVKGELVEMLEEQQRERMREGRVEMFGRLLRVVRNLADICLGDKRVYASVVGNVRSQVGLLRGLNLENDEGMREVVDEVERELLRFDVEVIRKDKGVKTDVGDRASGMVERLQRALMSEANWWEDSGVSGGFSSVRSGQVTTESEVMSEVGSRVVSGGNFGLAGLV